MGQDLPGLEEACLPSPRVRTTSENASDGLVPAAEYVRMSTDHQRYSTENQSAAIHAYAMSHGAHCLMMYRPGRLSSKSFWSMTSVVGDGFRTPMRVLTTNTSAPAPASGWCIAQSPSKTTVRHWQLYIKASSDPWPASTPANCPKKVSKANSGSSKKVFTREGQLAMDCVAH